MVVSSTCAAPPSASATCPTTSPEACSKPAVFCYSNGQVPARDVEV